MSDHRAPDERRCSVRQKRVVLAPVAGVKLPVTDPIQPECFSHQAGGDGDKTNSSPGRARHKPLSHCAGNAGVFPLNLYARVRFSHNFAHETAGAARTRHSLLPFSRGQTFMQTSGTSCRENADVYLSSSGNLIRSLNPSLRAKRSNPLAAAWIASLRSQ